MTTKDIIKVYLGTVEVPKLYLGNNQVYPTVNKYVTTYDLNIGVPNTTLTLPFNTPIRYENLRIDWGDGTTTVGINTHTYDSLGVYEITIYGSFTGLTHETTESDIALKLVNISNWGDIGVLSNQYTNCVNLEITAEDNTVRSDSNWLVNLFKNCKKITEGPSISSNLVTNVSGMYEGCDNLASIGTTNFPNVTGMSNFAKDCPLLDVDLSYMCVPLVASQPVNFVTGSPLMTEEKLPIWGTCP